MNNFSDFCSDLLKCGFSMGGGNDKGIYAVVPYGWEKQDTLDTPVKWHTGDPETDPWEWRMRVIEERNDIAYSKVFFKTSGYITKAWYPLFFSVRRNGESIHTACADGRVSRTAKLIYDIISENAALAFHEIKQIGGFGKENNSQFESALVELQMRMFITMCGRKQKTGKSGVGYGWNSTAFTTVESFWKVRGVDIDALSAAYTCDEAGAKIAEQIFRLNPQADIKNINKFIRG